MNVQKMCKKLVKKHGSYRLAAKAVGLGKTTIYQIATGQVSDVMLDTYIKIQDGLEKQG